MRLTGTNKNFGVALRYCYDRFGQVETKDAAGCTSFGPAVGWVYGNGRTLSRSHDLDYRAQTIQDNASGGLSLHCGYDAAGQLTELKDGLQSAFLARYDYDNLGRLTVLRDGPTATAIETYTYDATGHRTSLLHGVTTTNLTYPSTSHRLTSVGGQARTYDGAGNTVSIDGGAKEYDYTDLDRLTQVRQGGTVMRSYQYNALGERVKATHPVTSASTHTTTSRVNGWATTTTTVSRCSKRSGWTAYRWVCWWAPMRP
ncbi:hypothetical protein ASD78_02375 [Lysobacter sp. Root667]|uniref:hypothetical protein n=1 Tax=Lysobacter sp. Root667 TaxID=1736581 RepID=UPI000715D79C|nr:hypothetical protein [Lysobacter sp. Root667]KRA76506.1 hypothetical protein ASD78_02375 [Lysobacter sp. Root667]